METFLWDIFHKYKLLVSSETLQIVLWTLSSYPDLPELLPFLNPEVDGAFSVFLRNAPFKTF